jgi:hypothetical protein
MNAPKTLDSGNPDFPISDGSVRASPPGYNLTIRPLPITVINPLIGVSEFVTSRCTCIRNLRFPICFYTGSLPRFSLWSTGPYYMTLIEPLIGVSAISTSSSYAHGISDGSQSLTCQTILSPVVIILPPVLLTVGVAPRT